MMGSQRCWKRMCLLLAAWVFVLLLMNIATFGPMEQDADLEETLRETLKKVQAQKDELQRLSQEMTNQLQNLHPENRLIMQVPSESLDGPSSEHEFLRRNLERVTTEFWFYLSDQMSKLKGLNNTAALRKTVDSIVNNSIGYQRMLKNDFNNFRDVDSMGLWRKEESRRLGSLVQRRISYLQNRGACKRLLLCRVSQKLCGYGCLIHHVSFCLMTAYVSNRTMVLDSVNWIYERRGLESVFMPLTKCPWVDISEEDGENIEKAIFGEKDIVALPSIDKVGSPWFVPTYVPEDLADRLLRFHGNPVVWWVGQFIKYITRPNAETKSFLEERKNQLGFQNPIVGVHVRRSDKIGTEAQKHELEEYMSHVGEWFDTYERRAKLKKRVVFLATDEPGVITEARQRYPAYTFIADMNVSLNANGHRRYNDVKGIIQDTHLLSLTDFIVCTFSSQVCRIAYELMQTMHGDASGWFRSLDDIYYFGGQHRHVVTAVEAHVPQTLEEIPLEPGDEIVILGNHWNGYSKGRKKSPTGLLVGLFPSYKVKDSIRTLKLPTYPEVQEL